MPLYSQEYGRQRIRFGMMVNYERCWAILCHLHKLHVFRNHALLKARPCHACKAVERVTADCVLPPGGGKVPKGGKHGKKVDVGGALGADGQ